MERGIDHLVVAGRDLDGLGGAYRRLGFLVGGRNRHPWGTENRIVQLEGSFLELIGLAADFEPLGEDNPAAPFANTVARGLDRREGLAMVAVQSADAKEDARRFAAAGLGLGAPLHFSRTAEAPDGTRREVAFTTAFTLDAASARPEFFACQHHRPENFWNGAMQRHPNGARRLLGLVMTADAPPDLVALMGELFGAGNAMAGEAGLVVRAGRQTIEIVTGRRFRAMFGDAVDEQPAVVRIGVEAVDAVQRFLNVMGSPYALRDNGLIVPAKVGRGVMLSFEPL